MNGQWVICEFYIFVRKFVLKGYKFMQVDIKYRSCFLLLGWLKDQTCQKRKAAIM